MIDTHAHLDAVEDASGAIDRARQAGVNRVITIGTGIDSCRRALALTAHDGVYAALGIDPHQAATDEAHRVGELRELLAHERAVAVGEAGLDYHYGAETKDEQRRLFEAQVELARELRLPVVVHTREANDDTAAILLGHDGTVVMHCFSEPGLLAVGLERGWYFSFAGNVTYPKASTCARLPPPFPPTGSSPRRTAPTWRRSRCGGSRTSRPTSSTRSPLLPPPAERMPTSSRRGST